MCLKRNTDTEQNKREDVLKVSKLAEGVMYRWLWSTAGGVCLALFLDAARAESTDWEDNMRRQFQPSYDDRWKRHRSRALLSTGAIVGIVVAFVAAVVSVFLCCCYRRRRRRALATQHQVVPPAMTPAMSGVAPYTYAGSYPPVPVAMTSAVAPYPQQPNYYEQQAAEHAQRGLLHAGHHMASPSQQPSTMPMPSPTAPPEPPPPYNYRANYPH